MNLFFANGINRIFPSLLWESERLGFSSSWAGQQAMYPESFFLGALPVLDSRVAKKSWNCIFASRWRGFGCLALDPLIKEIHSQNEALANFSYSILKAVAMAVEEQVTHLSQAKWVSIAFDYLLWGPILIIGHRASIMGFNYLYPIMMEGADYPDC